MKSLTYGTLPSITEWSEAWEREENAGNLVYPALYRIQLNSMDSRLTDMYYLGSGDWPMHSLYLALEEIIERSQITQTTDYDKLMDLVSSILGTMGFEWI